MQCKTALRSTLQLILQNHEGDSKIVKTTAKKGGEYLSLEQELARQNRQLASAKNIRGSQYDIQTSQQLQASSQRFSTLHSLPFSLFCFIQAQ